MHILQLLPEIIYTSILHSFKYTIYLRVHNDIPLTELQGRQEQVKVTLPGFHCVLCFWNRKRIAFRCRKVPYIARDFALNTEIIRYLRLAYIYIYTYIYIYIHIYRYIVSILRTVLIPRRISGLEIQHELEASMWMSVVRTDRLGKICEHPALVSRLFFCVLTPLAKLHSSIYVSLFSF